GEDPLWRDLSVILTREAGEGDRRSRWRGRTAHTDAPGRPRAPGAVQERTTAEPRSTDVPYAPLQGPEFCSAVVTGVLGVHRGVPGRLSECPTAAECQSRPDHALRVSPVALRGPRTNDT